MEELDRDTLFLWNIRELHNYCGASDAQMAEICGVETEMLRKFEDGVSLYGLSVENIAEYFNLAPEELFKPNAVKYIDFEKMER